MNVDKFSRKTRCICFERPHSNVRFSFVPFPLFAAIAFALLLLTYGSTGVKAAAVAGDQPPNVVGIGQQTTIPDADSQTGCGNSVVDRVNPDFEARVVELVNQIRLDHGLLPMKRVETLDQAAQYHATDMAVDDYFAHSTQDRVDGALVEVCTWSQRIQSYYSGWNYISENIAAGYTTPEEVVEGWMDSPGHKKNILSEHNWEIGVGYYEGSGTYNQYWVQDFGRRQDVYPIIINGDASQTDNGDLTLHIYGDWQDVRLRTDEGTWSGWQQFSSALDWHVEGDAGMHTVSVELRNGDETTASSDSIYFSQSTTQPSLNDLPDRLSFLYSTQANTLSPDAHTLQPLNQDADPELTWRTQVDGNWLDVTPASGTPTDSLQIKPSTSSAGNVSEHTAHVTVSLYDEGGNFVMAHEIELVLEVTENAFQNLYIPVVMDGN